MENKNNPKITIVTVTYNAQDYLEKTIRSVIDQDYKNIEYIIIDGKSTDGTIDIIKKYEKHISYWVTEPDNGIYDAMNKGIISSSGDWLFFLNAGDTFVKQSTIRELVNSLQKDTDILYGDIYIVDENMDNHQYIPAGKLNNIWTFPPCWHQGMLIKTSIHKNNLFDLEYKLASDYDFMMKCYKKNYLFTYINIPFCNYLKGGMSTLNLFNHRLEATIITANYLPNKQDLVNHIFFKDMIQQYNKKKSLTNNFAKNISQMIINLENIKSKYKRIAIYGYGTTASLIIPFLSEELVIITDQNYKNINSKYPLCSPEELINFNFDCIIISLLGRELEITGYLQSNCKIDESKILTLI